MQLTTLSKKEHRGVISLPRKGDSWNWVEDVWEQVRHCVDCLEPMMLSDYMNKNGYKHQDSLNYKYNWIGNVYIDGGKHDESGYSYCDKCSNRQYRWKKDNEAKPYADTNHLRHLLYEIRKEYGMSEVDTPSTYDPWELGEVIHETKGAVVWEEGAVRELYNYLKSVRFDYRLGNGTHKTCKWVFWTHPGSRGHVKRKYIKWSFIMHLINLVFPKENVNGWPLWIISQAFGSNHRGRKGLLGYGSITDCDFREEQLYEALVKFVYDGKPTRNDFMELCSKEKYTEMAEQYYWLPSRCVMYLERKKSHPTTYNSMWDFIDNFQNYCYPDGSPEVLHKYDFTLLVKYSWMTMQDEWSTEEVREIGKHWFFNHLCKELDLQIDEEAFPHKSSQNDLEQVINVLIDSINKIDLGNEDPVNGKQNGVFGAKRIVPKIACLDRQTDVFDFDLVEDADIGIKKIVELLWPDYEMEENLWNRKEPGEKNVHSKMRKVMSYFTHNYEYSDVLNIPTRTGRVARYRHSRYPMKVDGISRDLWYIIEVQGDYHYTEYTIGASWRGEIPKCYTGNATTYLEFRQEQDAKCKRAIKRHGFTPVYIPSTTKVTPVKGVHGDLLPWNYRYVTGGSTNAMGLAELFDMQGRKDVGDMIRYYYHNVVMKMTKEMRKKLEE